MAGCVSSQHLDQKLEMLRIGEDNNCNVGKASGSTTTPDIITPKNKNSHAYYKMDHPNRGRCVIFNHEHFLHLKQRRGTHLDVQRIQKTFGKLGFQVDVCNDFNYDDIMDQINELSNEDHSQNDCLCIIVLSHGEDNYKMNSRNKIYDIKDLTEPFTADRCTTLAGKPKLFFFSACRGEEQDNGVLLHHSVERTETDGQHYSVIPSEADFLFAFSTPPGYVSHREPNDGTWFIQSLCDVLDEYAATDHLIDILIRTTNEVSKRSFNNDKGHQQKQVPEIVCRLRLNVYFQPKELN